MLMHEDLVPPPDATLKAAKQSDWRTEYHVLLGLKRSGHVVKVQGLGSDLTVIRKSVEKFKPQIVFNLMEEFDGVAVWDQNVVSYLELLKIPYTGCNPRGLILARDKALTKTLLSYHDIPVPQFQVFPKGQKIKTDSSLKFPLIVKSLTEESSTGISQNSVVKDEQKLSERVEFIHQSIGTDAIVESYIEGRELYAAILGNARLQVLPIWELDFRNIPENVPNIATSKIKWNPNFRDKYKITTRKANLDENTEKKIQDVCKQVYKVLGLSGYARLDLRLTPDGDIFVLEANPNPDVSIDEDFADSADKAGIKYPELLSRILNLGIAWYESRT